MHFWCAWVHVRQLVANGEARKCTDRFTLMLQIHHTTPGRLLGHLHKLLREGEEILAQPSLISVRVEAPWDSRVWRCLGKIAHPNAFDGALQLDQAGVGPINLLEPVHRRAAELDRLVRRRMERRLVTLVSVIEKVEAMAELPSGHQGQPR